MIVTRQTKPSLALALALRSKGSSSWFMDDESLPHWGRLILGRCILPCCTEYSVPVIFFFCFATFSYLLLLLRLSFEGQRRAQQTTRTYP